jgi:predicted GIY-YIG superfamily endonuclease
MDAEIGDEFHYILQCQSLENEIYIGAAVYQWYEFKSRRGKNKKLTAQKSNSNIVWFNFQTYIYVRIRF